MCRGTSASFDTTGTRIATLDARTTSYVDSAENYLRKFDGSSTFAFAPGRGFWAISDSSWSVQDRISTVPLRGAPGPSPLADIGGSFGGG